MKPRFRTFHERGLVLFIALIALVVLSLAAVALIRSVDTATIIAGNLAFKQSATNSGEGGLIRANQWLAAQAISSATALDTSLPAVGYYAINTYTSNALLSDSTIWADGKSQVARVADCAGAFTSDTDCGGNQIRYVIERMCNVAGPASEASCLYGPVTDSTSSQTVKDATRGDGLTTSSGAPMFRITARVIGPKNSVSYIQTFIY